MGRTRDVSKILTSNTSILSLASASSIYQTIEKTGLVELTPSTISVTGGSGSISATGGVSFTSASAISLKGKFSATYNFYKLVIAGTSSGDVGLTGRYRVAGENETGANYSYTGVYTNNAAGPSRSRDAGATSHYLGSTGTNSFGCEVTLFNPFSTNHKKIHTVNCFTNYAADREFYASGGQYNATTSYDSYSCFVSSGTFTGTISVYGYNK
jgi:hypothetical protein